MKPDLNLDPTRWRREPPLSDGYARHGKRHLSGAQIVALVAVLLAIVGVAL